MAVEVSAAGGGQAAAAIVHSMAGEEVNSVGGGVGKEAGSRMSSGESGDTSHTTASGGGAGGSLDAGPSIFDVSESLSCRAMRLCIINSAQPALDCLEKWSRIRCVHIAYPTSAGLWFVVWFSCEPYHKQANQWIMASRAPRVGMSLIEFSPRLVFPSLDPVTPLPLPLSLQHLY